jgi:hypothetical protein
MDAKRYRAVVLVVLGAAAYWFGVRPLLGPSDATWREQIRRDALSLRDYLRPDPWVEDDPKVEAAWDKRRVLYDEKHLERLRERLDAYVDFEIAEWADAKNIYLSGRLPDKPSDNALAARTKLEEAFGDDAKPMIEDFAKGVREPAYRASPKVGGGIDPDLPKFDEAYDKLAAEWVPKARARIGKLTAPAR